MDKKCILHLLKFFCRSFRQLHQVHGHAITSGVLSDDHSVLSNILHTIVSIAATKKTASASCVHFVDYAASIFCCMETPDTFSYNTMMRAYILSSSPSEAIMLFFNMRHLSVPPDFHTFPFALKATHQLPSLPLAFALHSQAFKFGFLPDLYVLNSLIHVYSLSNCLQEAYRLFQESRHQDVVSFNALINGFVKVGDTHRARELFDAMPTRDAVSWGTLVSGYAQTGQCNEAINLFNEMIHSSSRGLCPDNVSIVSALSASAQLGDLDQGMLIHKYITKTKINIDGFLSTALVDFYAKCGCIQVAMDVFAESKDKNLYTWNAMLVGLAVHGFGKESLNCFFEMVRNGIQPDGVTFLGLLAGCSHGGLVSEAKKLFDDMQVVYGVQRELKHYGCMADLLGRAGLIEEAFEMIENMPVRGDVYVWGALLGGCRLHGSVELAEKVAERVRFVKPEDGGVYSIMANVYANAGLWDDVINTRTLMNTNKMVKKSTGYSSVKVEVNF